MHVFLGNKEQTIKKNSTAAKNWSPQTMEVLYILLSQLILYTGTTYCYI